MAVIVKAGYYTPLSVCRINSSLNIAVEIEDAADREYTLNLYKSTDKKPELRLDFPKDGIYGRLYTMLISGLSDDFIAYSISCGSRYLPDRKATCIAGRESFGKRASDMPYLYLLPKDDGFDWEGDTAPMLRFDEAVAYKLNVRAFTKELQDEHAGSFAGIQDKIPYFKSIGVNQLELMPCYDFDEVEQLNTAEGHYGEPTGRRLINLWGYKPANYYAMKSAFASGDSAAVELKTLIRELHQNGMELILELYFDRSCSASFVIDVVRYYIFEYHIDGVHIMANASVYDSLLKEPMMHRKKLYIEYTSDIKNNVYSYNDGFLINSRRLLRGDDYAMEQVISYFMLDNISNINYYANNNGFSLADSFAYEKKHNEKNGFENADGTDYNYSWSCGKEGYTRSAKITRLRTKMIKNALFLTLLSRGIPLIMSGDEMGKTKKGNNNSFCQDNSLSYTEWDDLEKNAEIIEFFKDCTRFRAKNAALSCGKEQLSSAGSTGWPFVSLHSEQAWSFKNPNQKAVGIMLNGECCIEKSGRPGNIIYIGINMYSDAYNLALPILPKGYAWSLALTSSDGSYISDGFLKMEEQSCVALHSVRI